MTTSDKWQKLIRSWSENRYQWELLAHMIMSFAFCPMDWRHGRIPTFPTISWPVGTTTILINWLPHDVYGYIIISVRGGAINFQDSYLMHFLEIMPLSLTPCRGSIDDIKRIKSDRRLVAPLTTTYAIYSIWNSNSNGMLQDLLAHFEQFYTHHKTCLHMKTTKC